MTTTTKELIEKIIIDYKAKCKKGIFCNITYSHIDNLKKTLQKHLQELPQQEVKTYEQWLEDWRKEVLDKVEELISKIKILEITWLPLSYKIILEQLQSLLPTIKDDSKSK